jgi:hypothetical protein
MAEGRLPKIALKWMPKQKSARVRPKKSWMESIKMNERNLNEGQWEDRKQWSQVSDNVEKRFETDIYIYIYKTLASSNCALPDDGDNTEICWSCFSVNFNVV